MIGYPSGRLLEEVAYVAYYLHWQYEEIMSMDHRERRWWIAEVARIHDRLNEADQTGR
jgi:Family of unknown function (DUF6760)